MDKGISNKKIDDEQNEDLKKIIWVFIQWFNNEIYNFYEIIKKRNAKYAFAIFNTDRHN